MESVNEIKTFAIRYQYKDGTTGGGEYCLSLGRAEKILSDFIKDDGKKYWIEEQHTGKKFCYTETQMSESYKAELMKKIAQLKENIIICKQRLGVE